MTRNMMELSVVVQWDEVDDSLNANYTVNWTSDGTDSVQSRTLIEQSSCTITGLTLDTVYAITVTASNKCGTKTERTSVTFSTGMYHHHYLLAICSNPTIIMTACPCGLCSHLVFRN